MLPRGGHRQQVVAVLNTSFLLCSVARFSRPNKALKGLFKRSILAACKGV